jgi:RHS repeat-associated protein
VDEGDEVRGGVVRKVYRLGSERVAVREGSAVYAAVGDHLGSVTVLAQGGSPAGVTRYLPYGAIRLETGLSPTDRRYTGQRWEASLGLYDYRARFYDPALGRFLQPDPIVPEPGNLQALNRYVYVYNNPLHYTDPSGHTVDLPCPWCDRPWISTQGWPGLAVDLAKGACGLLGCRLDPATGLLWEPPHEEWLQAQGMSLAGLASPIQASGGWLKAGGAEVARELRQLGTRGVSGIERLAAMIEGGVRGTVLQGQRALYYAEQLQGVEVEMVFPKGKGRVDLLLTGNRIVETKPWDNWENLTPKIRQRILKEFEEQVTKYPSDVRYTILVEFKGKIPKEA